MSFCSKYYRGYIKKQVCLKFEAYLRFKLQYKNESKQSKDIDVKKE